MLAHAFATACGPTAAVVCDGPSAAAAAADQSADCGGHAAAWRHSLLHAAVDSSDTSALFVAQDPLTWWGQVHA